MASIFEEMMSANHRLTESAKPSTRLGKKKVESKSRKISYKNLKIESRKFFEDNDLDDIEKDFEIPEEDNQDQFVLVIDPEVPAEDEIPEDAAADMIGDKVYKCPVCGSNYVCSCDEDGMMEDMEVDADGAPVECPICGDDADQILIGEITPAEDAGDETVLPPQDVEDAEVVEDEEEVSEDEASVNESLQESTSNQVVLSKEDFNKMCKDNQILTALPDKDYTEIRDLFSTGYFDFDSAVNELWHGDEDIHTRSYYEKILKKALQDKGTSLKDPSLEEAYGVFRTGGSVGDPRPGQVYKRFGRETGVLVQTFSTQEEAKEDADFRNAQRSPGEKSYYKIKYKVASVKDDPSQKEESMEYDEDPSLDLDTPVVEPVPCEESEEEVPAVEVTNSTVTFVFDDSKFESLMTKMVKENYKNKDASFEVSKVRSKKGQLTVEYVVRSGKKSVKGTLVGEGFNKSAKRMKISFKDKGVFTESFAETPSFVVECVVRNRKVVPVKMSYDYKVTVNESLYRVAGKVK